MENQIGAMPEEKNTYELQGFHSQQMPQLITFYKKNLDGGEESGTTLEEVIRVAILRLSNLNMRFGCRENSLAITKLEEALMWLNKRTEDRIERGVEGKHQV